MAITKANPLHLGAPIIVSDEEAIPAVKVRPTGSHNAPQKPGAHLDASSTPIGDTEEETRQKVARLLRIPVEKLRARDSRNHASARAARGAHSPELLSVARLLKTTPEKLIAEGEAWRREQTVFGAARPAAVRADPEVATQIERNLRLRPGQLAGGDRVSINRAGALKGRQVVDEALAEMDADAGGEAAGANAAELAELARDAIDKFLAEPEGDDAWRELGKAGALIAKALDDSAPPYADRTAGGPAQNG